MIPLQYMYYVDYDHLNSEIIDYNVDHTFNNSNFLRININQVYEGKLHEIQNQLKQLIRAEKLNQLVND